MLSAWPSTKRKLAVSFRPWHQRTAAFPQGLFWIDVEIPHADVGINDLLQPQVVGVAVGDQEIACVVPAVTPAHLSAAKVRWRPTERLEILVWRVDRRI